MRDPYLFEDTNVLKNFAEIKNNELLSKAEADITNFAMNAIYNNKYENFTTDTLKEIHKLIFGQIYDWAGEFRSIQIIKAEDILGGDTVKYSHPKEIKKNLKDSMNEIKKLKGKGNGNNDKDIIFRLVRIIAQIWQTHPFREGNTRCVIVFAVLFANSLGFTVEHELFKVHSSYLRNALVWASQGIYSKYEYLERIFYDAILHQAFLEDKNSANQNMNYEKIGDYNVKDYKEQAHVYVDE